MTGHCQARRKRRILCAAASILAMCASATVLPAQQIVGADASFARQAESDGVHFKDNGKPLPALQILKSHGYNWIRLRVFYAPTELPNNLAYTIAEAKDVKKLGFHFLLDIHYSDTWADPKHQSPPKAWQGYTHAQLVDVVYTYTRDTIAAFRSAGVTPDMVEVGNEINHGMLWPDGKVSPDNWGNFTDLLKSGVRGVRAGSAGAKQPRIMLHIASSTDVDGTRHFFDEMVAHEVPFDVLGQSYYPWGSGPLKDLKTNLDLMASRYKKDIIVVETAYCWRDEECKFSDGTKPAKFPKGEFPSTPQGQKDFLSTLAHVISTTPGGRGKGFFYWEPEVQSSTPSLFTKGYFDADFNALPVLTDFDAPQSK